MIYFAETSNNKIFTTGAFLQPMKVRDAHGNDFWIWATEKFEGSCFCNGEAFHPVEVADSLENLLMDNISGDDF